MVAFLPALVAGQMMPAGPDVSAERLREQALELEKKGQWEAAFQIYHRLLAQDRQNTEYREKLLACQRHLLRDHRLLDSTVQERVLSLQHGQLLALYDEVITKLAAYYVDRDKSLPTRLFQHGLEELDRALADEGFREKYLKNVADSTIRQFRQRLREAWSNRSIASAREAKDLVGEIAAAARRDLRLQKVNVVVLEFLCGACNSLDEFTAYLSPGQMLAELTANPDVPSVVEAAILKDGIAYARITHFRESTAQELDAALAGLRMLPGGANVQALVLDLRGNPGGSFEAAVRVAERFLPQGVIVTTHGQATEVNKIYTSTAGGAALTWRLYVLVDGETASAAEVLAAALRDHQRATLVGTPTFGKGTIQCLIQFETAEERGADGKPRSRTGGVKITLARFFSPNGQALSGGITPHLVQADKDRQLGAALDDAARYVTMMMTLRPQ